MARTVNFQISDEEYKLAVKLGKKFKESRGGVSWIAKEIFKLGLQGAIEYGLITKEELEEAEEKK